MKNNKMSDFVYGVQYYRAPTPLPEEWENDLRDMHKTGIDTIQLRIQWRWNEPSEGNYQFDDIDALFDLAVKYRKKVIIKFMMETAPDYIFQKYGGTRINLNGAPISPGAHGAYYIGGWWPCFENPDVMRKALAFVETFTRRYKTRENLILWNIWNEPRTRPIGDCCCEHSNSAYRKWLKEKFGTIEALNHFWGKKWESFDTVNPPGMPHDYAETFLWRKWAMHAVSRRLAAMYEKVKSIDESRPVMAHVGTCSICQDVAGDGSDDMANSSETDFYGSSLSTANQFTNMKEESVPFMICDWIRSVSEYYWIHELYPDWGDWCRPVTEEDFKFKVWSTLACGVKGIVYWQYRAERVGNENNLSGLVHIDGRFKKLSCESAEIGAFIRENEAFLADAKVKHDGIAILYSQDSDMINRLENTGNKLYDFNLNCGSAYLYKKSLWGVYSLFREMGYTTVWIDSRKLKEKLQDVKALYLPEYFIVSEENIEILESFVKNGGSIIAEEGIGLRQSNTWLNTSWPSDRLARLFGVKIEERVSQRRMADDTLTIYGHTVSAGEFISYSIPDGAEVIGRWSDGRPGAVKKDRAFFLGTGLGATFYDNPDAYAPCIKIMSRIMEECSLKPRYEVPRGVYVREIFSGEKKMLFIFNRTDSEKSFSINGQNIAVKSKDIKVTVN